MYTVAVFFTILGLSVAAPQNFQTLPISYQSQPLTYASSPVTLQSSQPVTIETQPLTATYQDSQVISADPINYQQVQVPVQVQSSPRISVQNVRPNTVRVQTLRTVQPVQTVRTVQTVQQPQLHTIVQQSPRVQTYVQQAPQVQTYVHQAPQVQTYVQKAPTAYTTPNVQQTGHIAILKQFQDVQADGSYQYSYETDNGIQFHEAAERRPIEGRSDGSSGLTVVGSYSYTSPENTPIVVKYTADTKGFYPEGDHIHPAIARALEYLRSLPERPEDAEGKYVPDRT